MLTHIVVALGAAGVIVEGHAGANDIQKRRTAVAHCRLDERHQLRLVARETATHKGGTELQRHANQINRAVVVDDTFFTLGALISCRRKLAFGQAIDSVVFNDVNHPHTASHGVSELAQANRG